MNLPLILTFLVLVPTKECLDRWDTQGARVVPLVVYDTDGSSRTVANIPFRSSGQMKPRPKTKHMVDFGDGKDIQVDTENGCYEVWEWTYKLPTRKFKKRK